MPKIKVRKILLWLASITRPVHRALLLSIVMRFCSQTLNILLFAVGAGGIIAVWRGNAEFSSLLTALVVMAVLKAISAYLEQFSGHFVAFKALELLRTQAFSLLWPKSPYIVTRIKSGDMLASLTRDIDRIEVLYAHTVAPVLSGIFIPLFFTIGAGICWGWNLVWAPLLCVLLAIFVVPFIGFRTGLAETEQLLQLRRDLAQHVTDSVFGAEEVTVYGQEKVRVAEMGELGEKITFRAVRSAIPPALRRGISFTLPLFSMLGVFVSARSAGSDPCLLAVLLGGCLKLFAGTRDIAAAVDDGSFSLAAAQRLYEICHADTKIKDGNTVFSPTAPVAVEWRKVSYSYPESGGKPVLKNLSMRAEAGQKSIITGASGTGKSTAVQLLLRYDDPDSGEIFLDGRPVQDYTLDSLRRGVAFVPQRAQLLNSTIADNLRLGNAQASVADLWKVLEIVELADYISSLPQGLDTPTGTEGTALSGGQRQRLCLARALLTNPAVLVLDEFNANLNADLAERIRCRLDREFPSLTTVEITHRADIKTPADSLFVLDDSGSIR